MALGEITISTHVLDIARGTPANEMPVCLERKEGNEQWRTVSSGHTDKDGRCARLLLGAEELSPGIYRLTFDTESYFAAQNIRGLYPVVQVTFRVHDNKAHYHIPLLLSPHGYTTYRGS